jgi:hypothetical protein
MPGAINCSGIFLRFKEASWSLTFLARTGGPRAGLRTQTDSSRRMRERRIPPPTPMAGGGLTREIPRRGSTAEAGATTPASTLRPGPMVLCGAIALAGLTRLARAASRLPVMGPPGATTWATASLRPRDTTQIPAMGSQIPAMGSIRITGPARDTLSPVFAARTRAGLNRRSARTTAAAGGRSWCLTVLLRLARRAGGPGAGTWPRPLSARGRPAGAGDRTPERLRDPAPQRGRGQAPGRAAGGLRQGARWWLFSRPFSRLPL